MLGIHVLIIFPIVVLFFLVAYFLPDILFEIKKRKIEREEWKESIHEGGVEEPRPLRSLLPEEKKELEDSHRNLKRVVDNGWWLFFFFGTFDVAGIFLILRFGLEFTKDVVAPAYSIAFIIQFFLVGLAVKERPTYLDLRSPVFRVQGQIIKEKIQGRYGPRFYITVRRIKFSESNASELPRLFDNLIDGNEIAVEYSPRTKRVWKIFKFASLNNGDRVIFEYSPGTKNMWEIFKAGGFR